MVVLGGGAASPGWACLFACSLVHDRSCFFFPALGFPSYFWDSRLLPPVFFFFLSSSVCVCLSTQRLTALAKGKMSMAKMKMGREWECTETAMLTLLFKLKLSSVTTTERLEASQLALLSIQCLRTWSGGEMWAMLESSQCILVKAAWIRVCAQRRLETTIRRVQRGKEGQATGQLRTGGTNQER